MRCWPAASSRSLCRATSTTWRCTSARVSGAQDQLVGGEGRPPVELQQGLPVAEHLLSRRRAPAPGRRCARAPPRGSPSATRAAAAGSLLTICSDTRSYAELRRRPAHQQGRPHLPLADQVDGAPLAGPHLAVRTAREVDRRGVAGPQPHRIVPALAGEEVAEAEHRVLEVGDPDQLDVRRGSASQASSPACTLTCSYPGQVSSTTS